jgi:indole-3-glycerol phosphate synthase
VASTPSNPPPPDILDRIVRTKRAEVESMVGREAELRRLAASAPPVRDLAAALSRPDVVSLIAEVKRRSPGAGEIDGSLDPVRQARAYESGGAGALSVLTDRRYFQGSLDDLRRVRAAVQLPVLRKDFVIDERQVWEARGAGADAILLIVRILEDDALASLRKLAEELGMSALVEVHDLDELNRALDAGARVLGVNNRDLTTFDTDLEVTLGLLDAVPDDRILVSESGIATRDQVERLGSRGVDAILVGEALVRARDPEAGARRLSGVPLTPRRAGTVHGAKE